MLADDLAEVGEFDRSAAESTGYVPRSIMAAPLIRDGECIGVLEVLDRGDRTNGELSDVDLLALLASQASIGLDLLVRLRGLSPHGPADRRGPLAGSASVLIQRIEDHLRTADRSTTEVALKFLTATDDLLSPRSQRG
jgi:GAF domain-containing protein